MPAISPSAIEPAIASTSDTSVDQLIDQRPKLADAGQDRFPGVIHRENLDVSGGHPEWMRARAEAEHGDQSPPITASDVRTTDHRRVNTLHRNTGTATCGFIIASPSHAPPAIGRRTQTSHRHHGARQRDERELRQRAHASPAEKHQDGQHDHPEGIVRPEESRGEIRREHRHRDVQQHPDGMRSAERQQTERREQHDGVRRIVDRCPTVQARRRSRPRRASSVPIASSTRGRRAGAPATRRRPLPRD